ncbi:hypothetical protein A8E95_27570 [Burkholderia cenocepacia]|uniref:hypothetical protein n=1 Tax=Burkholderia TaxID=32008 RepID=UPI000487959D|nr:MULTISPECIES: hypothetical protein [Burkholderia]AQQ30948.1 hypothetical protein A8E96_00370 [Burkholderia cenocepacia]ONW27622.1 hypothetical protein A8E95_27570 [Burkholderia cenocepacia]
MLFDAARTRPEIEQPLRHVGRRQHDIDARHGNRVPRHLRMLGVVRCLRERDVRQRPKEVIDRERSIVDWSRLWQRRQPSDISSCMPRAIT